MDTKEIIAVADKALTEQIGKLAQESLPLAWGRAQYYRALIPSVPIEQLRAKHPGYAITVETLATMLDTLPTQPYVEKRRAQGS